MSVCVCVCVFMFLFSAFKAHCFELVLWEAALVRSPVEGGFSISVVGLGGLGVTCSLRGPSFAGSNPAEVNGFFQDVKILSTSPPRGSRV